MTDVAFLFLTVAFFALAVGYVLLCDRLAERITPPGVTSSDPAELE